jgi:diaminopimelate epimerase
MKIHFSKYQSTGNDFVLIDNREGLYDQLNTAQVRFLCDRRFGIGGDGLMLLNKQEGYDFHMKYYNSDGREGSMCGNGGRSIAQFAKHLGLVNDKATFMAVDGEHKATIGERGWVRLKMNPVHAVKQEGDHFILDTGSPHYVLPVDNVQAVNVAKEGAQIRYSPTFAAEGINVNFVEAKADGSIYVRTYERGVEAETYSCGTGVTASALVGAKQNGPVKVDVQTLGGRLSVEFTRENEQDFEDIWLCGPATFVFRGEISTDGM